MQIIFCNKYFFLNGGVERYLYNVMNYLSARGHKAIPFSVRYTGTWPSPYQDYFLEPPGDPGQAHLGNIRFTPANLLRFLDRSTYSFEARIKLSRLLKAVHGADIAFILNIYNYMSPSIIHTFKRHRIPVIMQMGDYNLLCANYSLLRNGKPCTLCVRGQYYHGFQYRCVKNNLAASAVRVAAMYLHRLLGIYKLVDALVVPCEFMKTKLMEGGFSEGKLHLLPYPVERRQANRRGEEDREGEGRREGEKKSENNAHALPYPMERKQEPDKVWHKKNYIVYFGRISYEKGLDTLIGAFQRLNPAIDLYIIGRSYDGEEERLRGLIEPHVQDRIHFLGFQSGVTLTQWIGEALFSVVPSRWYDNAPLSIDESFLYGTPVLASRIGGISEQVQEGVTGKLFEPDSIADLVQKMDEMLSSRDRLVQMGIAGQTYVKETLLIKGQMDSLMHLFETVSADYKRR
ncbi:MAG: glycosyltransferase family 4 protein [Syntrophales bacterium LBB04]|nr:glycosyltransferase family 4 protein [Syntrophales bacterium LBB04]